jgi:hypothetical protein
MKMPVGRGRKARSGEVQGPAPRSAALPLWAKRPAAGGAGLGLFPSGASLGLFPSVGVVIEPRGYKYC